MFKHPAQAENHSPLVFAHDVQALEDPDQEDEDDDPSR
jgi:hypothetical protein